MADVTNIKPLIKEDYPKEYQELIERLSFSLNPFMRQVVAAFANNIDFNNLAQSIVTFEATVDASGVPQNVIQIKVNPSKKIIGADVICVENLTDATNLTTAPFLTYTTNRSILTVNHITGLTAGKRYTIRAVLIV